MPTLRELQKRLESAETILQLSGAMRSAATAKYTKLCAALDAYSPYAKALAGLLPASGDGAAENDLGASPALVVLVSGNRGLCGGYHQQLFSYFSELAQRESFCVAVAGKKALDFCRSKKIAIDESFELSDVPTFAEAKKIAGYAYAKYSAREIGAVAVCCQRFYNMLKAVPETRVILQRRAAKSAADENEIIFIPDRASIEKELEARVFTANVYDSLLSAASAAQAATLVAMRSAYDNASESISSLTISINRLRQAAVTASVLETSADIKEQI